MRTKNILLKMALNISLPLRYKPDTLQIRGDGREINGRNKSFKTLRIYYSIREL